MDWSVLVLQVIEKVSLIVNTVRCHVQVATS